MKIQRQLGWFISVLMLATGIYANTSMAKEDVKETIKDVCSVAGGSYSSGANYARCQYSNGDSYTCNTDVNKCESCTNGKCTVSKRRPGFGRGPGGTRHAPPDSNKPKMPAAHKPAEDMNKK